MFGCQYSETGLFIKQLANGIMGMSASEATIVKHLYDEQKIKHNLFTMCFQRHDYYEKVRSWERASSIPCIYLLGHSLILASLVLVRSSSFARPLSLVFDPRFARQDQGVGSGAMVFGGVDTRLHTSPMLFVHDLKATGWYTVYINGIYLRDNRDNANGAASVVGSQGTTTDRLSVDISKMNNGKGVIVDSGTTDTYLSSSARAAFDKMWQEKVRRRHTSVQHVAPLLGSISTSCCQLHPLPFLT